MVMSLHFIWSVKLLILSFFVKKKVIILEGPLNKSMHRDIVKITIGKLKWITINVPVTQ